MKQNYANIIAGFFTGIIFFAIIPWIFSGGMRPGLAGYEIIVRIFPTTNIFTVVAALAVTYIAIGIIPFFIYRHFLNPRPAARAAFFRSFIFFASGIAFSYIFECATLGILFILSSPIFS